MKSKNGYIIDETHRKEIEAAIKQEQKNARLRKIDFDDIKGAVDTITRRTGLSVNQLKGSKYDVDLWAQRKAKSYEYAMYSTQFQLLFNNNKAYVRNITRRYTTNSGIRFRGYLSADAKESMIIHSETF